MQVEGSGRGWKGVKYAVLRVCCNGCSRGDRYLSLWLERVHALELQPPMGILRYVICLGISEALHRYLAALALSSKIFPGPRYTSSPALES